MTQAIARMTPLMVQLVACFDERGLNLRGGDYLYRVLKDATEHELTALTEYIRRQPGTRGRAMSRFLGAEIASTRIVRARAAN